MDFGEKLIRAVEELGIKDYAIFGTNSDGEGFAVVSGSPDKISGNVIGGTLGVPDVQLVMCSAVLELHKDCEKLLIEAGLNDYVVRVEQEGGDG
jgi:hypothetical protein